MSDALLALWMAAVTAAFLSMLFILEFFAYDTYLVEDLEFSHEAAARDYIASFTDDVPRRIIRRRRFQWRSAP
jgi:hypothetical protein